jgi:hypothetical protein
MKAIEFDEANCVYAKDTPIIGPIPAYMDKSPKGKKQIVACYYMGFAERLMVLFFGKVWITVVTGDGVLAPMWLSTVKKLMITNRGQRRAIEKKNKKPGVSPLTEGKEKTLVKKDPTPNKTTPPPPPPRKINSKLKSV